VPRSFAEQVCLVVNSIPPGETRTFREVAKEAGAPRKPTEVIREIIQRNRRGGLPWWRVIHVDRSLDPDHAAAQTKKLSAEGVVVSGGKVVER
jgi:alkylated DNA nucleotide flippase Atl1